MHQLMERRLRLAVQQPLPVFSFQGNQAGMVIQPGADLYEQGFPVRVGPDMVIDFKKLVFVPADNSGDDIVFLRCFGDDAVFYGIVQMASPDNIGLHKCGFHWLERK